MNKDKTTDQIDNTVENLFDAEASAIFKEAFYAEGKALEAEAEQSSFVEDEEKKEALRLRILAAAGRSEDSAVTKKKWRFTPLVRWAAVLILVCVGVFGVSMTSQAKGSGLWSSIQRLIGVETRWEQENNGEDRTYTNPEEEKAIEDIEENLDLEMPIFFYWPDNLIFSQYELIEDTETFLMIYTDGEKNIYFDGWKDWGNSSANAAWNSDGEVHRIEHDDVIYTVINLANEKYGTLFSVRWENGDYMFSLYGISSFEEVKKIIENIKN